MSRFADKQTSTRLGTLYFESLGGIKCVEAGDIPMVKSTFDLPDGTPRFGGRQESADVTFSVLMSESVSVQKVTKAWERETLLKGGHFQYVDTDGNPAERTEIKQAIVHTVTPAGTNEDDGGNAARMGFTLRVYADGFEQAA